MQKNREGASIVRGRGVHGTPAQQCPGFCPALGQPIVPPAQEGSIYVQFLQAHTRTQNYTQGWLLPSQPQKLGNKHAE